MVRHFLHTPTRKAHSISTHTRPRPRPHVRPHITGGLDKLCSDFPASYWYCAVEVNGVPTVVKDGWTDGNQTCTVDKQGCCTDDVLITDDKVYIPLTERFLI